MHLMTWFATRGGRSPEAIDRPRSRSRPGPIATALAAILVVGCGTKGDGLPRQSIDGAVTVDGQPLTEASIRFVPVDPKAGPAAWADLKAGSFVIDREQGPVPGRYRVIITRNGLTPGVEPLPAEYNIQTILAAEVKPGGPNSFHFPLASKTSGRNTNPVAQLEPKPGG